jgi:hemerythrin-like domain-containing protein
LPALDTQEHPVKAADIRRSILEEHEHLRRLLAELEPVLQAFEAEESGVGSKLRERGLALYERLARHLDSEQDLVTPALRASGPDGDRRADRLAHEHREQRELLRYLMSRLDTQDQPTLLVAREVRSFIAYLHLDMAHEEETMLTDEILGGATAPEAP